MSDTLERALDSLRKGIPVLIYDADGREEETDICYPSQFVDANSIRTLRKDAGGLICCVAMGWAAMG